MPPDPNISPNSAPRSGLRKIALYMLVLLTLALLYVGWIFYSRWQERSEIAERAAERKRADAEATYESLGGNRFEIMNFYASPSVIAHGDSAELCYGVSNAKDVRLDPPAGSVWPSASRCFQISPLKDTTYTLTADDGAGHTKTATVTVRVQ